MTNLLNIILMAPPADGKGGSNSMMTLIFFLLLIVIFYMFMIRPQMKKSKEQKKFRESLKKGDKVITIGGIHGKIIEIQDTTFTIETEGQGRLRVEKSAIATSTNLEPLEQK